MEAPIVMTGDSMESDIDGAQNVDDAVHFNPEGPIETRAWRSVRTLHELLDLPLGM